MDPSHTGLSPIFTLLFWVDFAGITVSNTMMDVSIDPRMSDERSAVKTWPGRQRA
ncbi:hypothetical protein LX36DRAFT_650520 [Colletotrichum falcatum]|nr:hypothetical protein LX36DRAFT_650520 [Colletotrichum falcatum]